MKNPKIDYALLGRALNEYQTRGYRYVEVPWMVENRFIRATLPDQFPVMTAGLPVINGTNPDELYPFNQSPHLIGSAEQGLLSLDLPLGAYVAVSPCFRLEPIRDLFHQNTFMKVELFKRIPFDERERSLTPGTALDHVLTDAHEVMAMYTDCKIDIVETEEGFDLEIGGVEVGSYGERTFEEQRWLYGTGLALPRFSVAKALDDIT